MKNKLIKKNIINLSNIIFYILIILNIFIFFFLIVCHKQKNIKIQKNIIEEYSKNKNIITNNQNIKEKTEKENIISTKGKFKKNNNISILNEEKGIYLLNKNEITKLEYVTKSKINYEHISKISNGIYNLFNYNSLKEALDNIDKNFNQKLKDILFFGHESFTEEEAKSSMKNSKENVRIFIEPLLDNKYSVFILLLNQDKKNIQGNFLYFKIIFIDGEKMKVEDNYFGIFDKE